MIYIRLSKCFGVGKCVTVWVDAVCMCAMCVCLVRLPFVCLFLCWQEKHFPQIIDYQNYIKNATKKRGTEREWGARARQGIPYISYGNKLFPTELSSHLPRLPSPPAPSRAPRPQQSDRIDCNNAINVMNVRAGIYIQLLTACVHVCEHVCAGLCLSMRV